jgi:hypothetical protein
MVAMRRYYVHLAPSADGNVKGERCEILAPSKSLAILNYRYAYGIARRIVRVTGGMKVGN